MGGRRSIRQLVALTRTARASVPASIRAKACSASIVPRTGLTRICHSLASATLMLTPACRPRSGKLWINVPRGTLMLRGSAWAMPENAHNNSISKMGKRRVILLCQHPSIGLLVGAQAGKRGQIIHRLCFIGADQ